MLYTIQSNRFTIQRRASMKKFRVLKAALMLGLTVVCSAGLMACSGNDQENSTSSASESSSVAATVNGHEIMENTVTNYIQNLRAQYGLTSDESWGSYLAAIGETPESLRENIINSYAAEELIKEAVADQNIVIADDEVQGYVDTMKANYSSDEAWQEALTKVGLTEDDYRDEIRTRLETNKFMETFDDVEDPTDEELLEFGQRYASAYDGAKRSAMILFTAEDQATAQEVADKIASGDLDFATAARQYSADSASAVNDGDQGWDKLNYPDSDYQTALDALEKDQVSDLIETSLGYQIIKCTDVFEAPKTTDDEGNETVELTSLDQLPEEWIADITESVKEQKQNEAYNTWVDEARESAEITINPMPESVPYNVDMSQYESQSPITVESETDDQSADEPVDETLTEDVTAEGETTPDGETTETVEAEGEVTPEDASTEETPAEGEAAEGADAEDSTQSDDAASDAEAPADEAAADEGAPADASTDTTDEAAGDAA